MTDKEYEQKRRECWEEFKNAVFNGDTSHSPYGAFVFAFDRAYVLGKQETKQEIKQETDAEVEEMLAVSRKEIQEIYRDADNLRRDPAIPSHSTYWNAQVELLQDLFGSKCLPDLSEVKRKFKRTEAAEPEEVAVAENATTTQNPTEPKFRLKDKVVRKNVSTIRTIVGIDSVSDETGTSYYYMTEDSHGNNKIDFIESDLELYTEPKYHKGEKVRYNGYVYEVEGLVGKNRYALKGLNYDLHEDMIEPYTEPVENHIAGERKMVDNIIKDGFSKERRLNIAAMMAQAILTRIDDTPQVIAEAAFRHADALITEYERGGSK